MGGWRYVDYLQQKSKQRLRKSEASLQDFRDLFHKKQVRSEDREAFQRKMDQVGDRRDREAAEVREIAKNPERAARRHQEE